MNAATVTERVKALRARKASKGLKEVRGLWAFPDDHKAIKSYAEKLARKRTTASPPR